MLAKLLNFSLASLFGASQLFAQVSCLDGQWRTVRSTAEEWEEFQIDSKCQMNGHYKFYKENRLRRSGHYKHQRKDGVFKYFFRDCSLAESRIYKDDELNGLRRKYYKIPAGETRQTIHYKNGLLDGISESFNPSGQVTQKVEYKDGLVEGKVVTYDESDLRRHSVREIRTFKSGQMLSLEIPAEKSRVDFSDEVLSDRDRFYSMKVGSKLIMAQFQLKDIVERERLSVLLPSDTCVPERRFFDYQSPQIFYSLNDSSNVCLKLAPEKTGKVNYQLFDGEGFLRERGGYFNNQRNGRVEFFKKGQLVYSRDFDKSVPSDTVLVFVVSEDLFKELLNRTTSRRDIKSAAFMHFDFKLGEFSKVDGRDLCKKAMQQRSYFLTDIFKKLDFKKYDSVRFLDETCRQGCAASCLKISETSQQSVADDYLQTSCNLGNSDACKRIVKLHPQFKLQTKDFEGRGMENDCWVNFDNVCLEDPSMSSDLASGITCFMGHELGCEKRNSLKAQKIKLFTLKCRAEFSSDWCERTAQNLKGQNELDGAKSMLKVLCMQNKAHKCVPYSKLLDDSKERSNVLSYACDQDNMESCLELGINLLKDESQSKALAVLESACLKDKVSTVIDIQTIAISKACKLAASIYNKNQKMDLAKKYYCEANIRMGYVKDCSRIKVISRK